MNDRAAYGAAMFARYEALDRALISAGWPPTSPWWLATVRRYFTSGQRQNVLRVGRRGGKSSTYCRVAVVEVLYGEHKVPPGDTGYAAFISHKREEAAERLATIKKILDLLGEAYRPIDGGIVLERMNRGFKVFTASIAGVSGFTGICILADEVAKWRDADTGANPAKEVLASVRPTMATQPLAKIVLSSSPLGRLDAHAKAYDEGDDDFQLVAFAPTWVANPTITEADTHTLERDEAKRLREYGAIPMEGDEESLFSAAMLDRATRRELGDLPPEPGVTYVATMDPGFTRNAWTFAIFAKRWVGDRIKRSVVATREWRGTPSKPLSPREVLRNGIAPVCRTYGVKMIATDRYEKFGMGDIASDPEIGLSVYVPEWNAEKRLETYESIETWMADDEVEIPSDAQFRADLLAVRQKLTPNGFTIHLPKTPDGRHCDHVPTFVLGMFTCHVDPAPRPSTQTREEAQAAAIRRDTDAAWEQTVEQIRGARQEERDLYGVTDEEAFANALARHP